MKSLNTKKIVAMATGAALLGSALLGAVSYQNTELINDNGAPMAKVVVGSNAHISDGVAAANIAAVLGNMAFKSVEVTATPTGINGLSCDVSGDSAGTCSVLSKSVDLEVVTPAGVIPAGAYGFSTLINDYIDANLENRNAISSSDKEDSSFGTNASIKKIKATDFTVLADYSVKDPQSSISAVQKQYLYVGSGTEDGDEGDATRVFYNADKSDYEVENLKMAYEIEFIDYGIPVCSDSKSGWWAYCKHGTKDEIDTDKQLENHRVKVKFLGEEWIISEMKSFVYSGKAVNTEYKGGSIKLAKESAYSPKLQIGEDLDLGDGNKLVLGDLKPASGGQENDIAIFSVLNAAGEEIASKTVAAGATTEITAGAATYRVRVYQVAPGYTLTEKWAEVAVFSNELLLEDGKDLEENKDWRVSLVWKDKDGDNATTNEVDHLHKIQLNLKNDVDVDNFRTGDSLTLVQDPAKFRLTFTGLDLVDSDYERVNLGFESKKSYYSSKPGISEDAGDATRLDSGYLVKMNAGSDLFTVNALNGSTKYSVDTLWLSYFTSGDLPVVLFEEDGYLYPINNFVNTTEAINFTIDYKVDKTKQMTIVIPNYTHALADTEYIEFYFEFEEDIGNDRYSLLIPRIVGDETKEDRYVFDSKGWADTDDYDTVLYGSNSENSEYNPVATYELPFITERGTKVDGRKTSMTIDFAKKIGKLSFVLQTTGATASEAGSMTYSNLHEGDSIDVLGAKVKVKAIDVETGPCTSATGAGSVTGIEGIACTINANVANLGERQNIPTDLVIMDKAATNVETVIAVGGPMVNDVTAALFPAENPLQGAGDVYIAEVAAGKIVVAGYTADDTMNAAMNFIATLRGQ